MYGNNSTKAKRKEAEIHSCKIKIPDVHWHNVTGRSSR